jgi:hypothetical protein
VRSPARVVDLQAEILPLVGTRDVELLPHRVVAVQVAFVKSKGFFKPVVPFHRLKG